MAGKRKGRKPKKARKPKEEKNFPLTKELLIVIIIVVIAILLAYMFYFAASKTKPALADVNGVPITQQDLNEIALTVPPNMRENISQEELLEQAINFAILKQEAKKIGVEVTDEEVEASIDASLQSAGLTREHLEQSLEQQRIEVNDIFNAYKKQLLSYKFMNETILQDIPVSEEEIKGFYEQYKDTLQQDYEAVKQDINRTIVIIKSQQMLAEWFEQKRQEYDIVRYK